MIKQLSLLNYLLLSWKSWLGLLHPYMYFKNACSAKEKIYLKKKEEYNV